MSLNLEGNLGLKSSPLATTSCKLTKKFLVLQHMTAHKKNMAHIKSSVDTSCPKTWYKHVIVKDQLRREKSANFNNRSRPVSAKSQNTSFINLESPILEEKMNEAFQSPNTERNMKDNANNLSINIIDKDIIDKNCNKFTPQKSFTPRILKNDKVPKLTQLKCYNPPKRKYKDNRMEMNSPTQNDSINISEAFISSEKMYFQEQSPPKPQLSEEEKRLKELDFLKDLTDDILLKHNFSDKEVAQTCDYHIKKNKYGLSAEQLHRLCIFVKDNTMGISQYAGEVNRPYITAPDDFDECYLRSIESNIAKQVMINEESAAPSRFQLSLMSNEGLESNQHSYYEDDKIVQSKADSLSLRNEFDTDKICETLETVQIQEKEKSLEIKPNLNETFDNDETIKNVHFASQNESFSAQNTDHSLTDISPIQVENSDDSTNVNISLEMNKTFKTLSKDSDMEEYDDDFDN